LARDPKHDVLFEAVTIGPKKTRKDNEGEFDLDIDAVILVTSRHSDVGLWRELKAREFDSPHPAHPLPWIRERQLWGGRTVPMLGDPRVDVEAG
jgi:dimethylamine/trimethylamine dehydrogenase